MNPPKCPHLTPVCNVKYAWINKVSSGQYGGKYEITLILDQSIPEHSQFMDSVYNAWEEWVRGLAQSGTQLNPNLSFTLFKSTDVPNLFHFKMKSQYQPEVWDTDNPPKEIERVVFPGARVICSIKPNFAVPQQGCGLNFYPQGVQVHAQGEKVGAGASFGAVEGGYVGNAPAEAAPQAQGFQAGGQQQGQQQQGQASQAAQGFTPGGNSGGGDGGQQQQQQQNQGFTPGGNGQQQQADPNAAQEQPPFEGGQKPADSTNQTSFVPAGNASASGANQASGQAASTNAPADPNAFAPAGNANGATVTTQVDQSGAYAPNATSQASGVPATQSLEGRVQTGVDQASADHHTGFPHQSA